MPCFELFFQVFKEGSLGVPVVIVVVEILDVLFLDTSLPLLLPLGHKH
jgi:hypothetical protein